MVQSMSWKGDGSLLVTSSKVVFLNFILRVVTFLVIRFESYSVLVKLCMNHSTTECEQDVYNKKSA